MTPFSINNPALTVYVCDCGAGFATTAKPDRRHICSFCGLEMKIKLNDEPFPVHENNLRLLLAKRR